MGLPADDGALDVPASKRCYSRPPTVSDRMSAPSESSHLSCFIRPEVPRASITQRLVLGAPRCTSGSRDSARAERRYDMLVEAVSSRHSHLVSGPHNPRLARRSHPCSAYSHLGEKLRISPAGGVLRTA